ncbi:MAG: LysM peptidoglycan-binding domain-containing protein [Actinomycetota bacterium]|nr:LysM peptidoglycan-binding domain-containing protein [Actinomycetota bacterium]
MTESFEPYRPESSYELDYDEEPERGRPGRILWGRVVVLGLALLLAFLLGRATRGAGGASEADLAALRTERNELREDLEVAEARLQQAQQEPTPPPASASPGTETDEGATDPENETEGGTIYVVESGDTLQSIAIDVYGDASLDDFLAEANDITDPESLAVGQELVIPPKPE